MAKSLKNWRRFIRLRLRTLLVFVTLCVILVGIRDFICRPYELQYQAKVKFEAFGGTVRSEPAQPSWLRYVVGGKRYEKVVGLTLRNGRVADAELTPIKQLPALQALTLGSWAITDEGMRLVGQLSNLHELDIGETSVSDDGLQHVANCRHLKQVTVPNWITDRGIAHLSNCTQLHSVSGGVVSLRGWSALANTQLRSLDVWTDPTEEWELLAKFRNLRDLRLYGMDDAKHVFSQLSNLSELTSIDASSTSINDDAIAELVKIPNLANVRLGTTRVGNKGLRMLLNKPTMRQVRLESSLLYPDEMARPVLKATHIEDCDVLTPWSWTDGFVQSFSQELSEEEQDALEKRLRILPCIRTSFLAYSGVILQPTPWLMPEDLDLEYLKSQESIHLGGLEGPFDLSVLESFPNLDHLTVPDTIDDAGLQQLAKLTQLESISIDSSRITSQGIRNLASLKNLSKIELYGMWLTNEDEKWVRDAFPNASIDFRGIRFSGWSERENLDYVRLSACSGISRNAVVESMDIAYQIAKESKRPLMINASYMNQFTNARFLDLAKVVAAIVDLDHTKSIDELAKNDSLRLLELEGESVSDEHLVKLAHLPLQELRLSNTKVTKSGLVHLGNMPLRTLRLTWWGGHLAHEFENSEGQLAVLANIPSLRSLHINHVSDAGVESLASVKQLTSVSVSSHEISEQGVRGLCELTNLETLYIKVKKPIGPELFARFRELPNMKTIRLDGPGTSLNIESYQQALPNVSVELLSWDEAIDFPD